jgi:hypothetical protein
LYYEDVDFCIRAKKAGFKTFVLPSISIYHKLSESVGKNSFLAIYHQTKGALLFGSKNFFFRRPFNLLFILLQSLLIVMKSYKSIKPILKAFFDYYKNNYLLIILLFSFLSFLSFRRVLDFTFWKDDWFPLYNPSALKGYLVHPAGNLEFLLFKNIFGINPFGWEFFGIIIRVVDSFVVYLLITKLTKSKLAGFLSGVFFASTFMGLDAVGWVSANASTISIFFVCLSIYFWLCYYSEYKNRYYLFFVLFFIIGMICDPARVFPLIFLLPVLRLFLFSKIKEKNFIKIVTIGFYIIFGLISVLIVIYLKKIGNSSFLIISHLFINPGLILGKIYLVGNFFGSLGNLLLGWIINIPETASTSVYNKLYARIAFILLPILGILSFYSFKTKSKRATILLFLILWIIVFYIPNWIAEPRLTLSGTHRFMVFSSVGFIGLTAYLISLLRNKYIMIFLSVFFMAMNIYASNRILSEQSKYRSKILVDSLWDRIDRDIPNNERNSIFMYIGEEPVRGQALALSGSIPFGIKRQIKDPYDLPIVTDDLQLIIKLLCSSNALRYQPGKMVVQKSKIPLSHYHVWEVKNNGSMKNISAKERLRIKNIAEKFGCKELSLQEENNN